MAVSEIHVPTIASAHTISNFVTDGFDLSSTQRENVKFIFRLVLPFRLRVGKNLTESFEIGGKKFVVCLRNQVQIPLGESVSEINLLTRDIASLMTEALIIYEKPKVSSELLEKIRKWNPGKDRFLDFDATKDAFKAKDAINKLIVAYSTAAKQMFGGTPLSLFGEFEFMNLLQWVIGYVGDEGVLTQEDVNRIFDMQEESKLSFVQSITGDLDDLPSDLIDGIGVAIKRQDDFIHLEMAFDARSKNISGDKVGAILLMVAALEGAHSTLVQHEFGIKIDNDSAGRLSSEYLRELGMTKCIELTPYLLLEVSERPTAEMINDCQFGLTVRNEIMHALKSKNGKYRFRNRAHSDLSRAYSGLMKMYDCYVTALERRIQPVEKNNNNETSL